MNDCEGFGLRITPGDAARSHEANAGDRSQNSRARIEGGTSARKSEAEEQSSVVRSPYGMKISARVGRPFTLEEERTGAGERRPAGETVPSQGTFSVDRTVLLGVAQPSTPREGFNLTSAGGAESAPRLEGSDLPDRPGRVHAGVSRLKTLLPRGWFKN